MAKKALTALQKIKLENDALIKQIESLPSDDPIKASYKNLEALPKNKQSSKLKEILEQHKEQQKFNENLKKAKGIQPVSKIEKAPSKKEAAAPKKTKEVKLPEKVEKVPAAQIPKAKVETPTTIETPKGRIATDPLTGAGVSSSELPKEGRYIPQVEKPPSDTPTINKLVSEIKGPEYGPKTFQQASVPSETSFKTTPFKELGEITTPVPKTRTVDFTHTLPDTGSGFETPKSNFEFNTNINTPKAASNISKLSKYGKGFGRAIGALGPAIDVAQLGSNLYSGDYEAAEKNAAEAVGGGLGAAGGAELGMAVGTAIAPGIGTLVGGGLGALAGSYAGSSLGSGALDYLKKEAEKPILEYKQKKSPDSINALMEARDKATDQKSKDMFDALIKRSQLASKGASPEEQVANAPVFTPYQESDRPKSLTGRPQSNDKDLEEFIGSVESGNDYTAVNPSSGAMGKYQFMKKDHEDEIKKRYGMSFEEAMSKPEIQDMYFRDVWLPQNKKLAAELAQTPGAKSKMLDEFTLTALLQLGQGNVKQYLAGTLPEDKKANIENQINYFKSKADEYKRNKDQENLDAKAIQEKTEEWQQLGNYLPFKSAQAKMDTLREGGGGFIRKAPTEAERSLASVESEDKEPIKETVAEERPRSRLEEALEMQRRYEMMARSSRAAELMGRGLSSIISKVAPSKMSDGEYEESLSRIGKQGVEGAKLLEAADTEREEADPTSARSKRAREQANAMFKSLGMDVSIPETTAAKDLKQYTDLAKYSTKAQAAGEKSTLDWMTKEKDKISKSKFVDAKAKADRSIALAESNLNSGVGDISLMYDTLKALDPNSAVRPGEIELLREAQSIWASLSNKLSRYKPNEGQVSLLDEKTKEEIRKLIKIQGATATKQYNDFLELSVRDAERRGVSREDALYALDQFYIPPSQTKPSELASKKQVKLPADKKYTPGSRITTKTGTFIVDSNGTTATEE